ncbi:MAG: hypothetical protein A2504_03110 [Bdellovibrionales bacterium RIFOXYD12_FULL_39_22]|nr:MAG: hypothetical protein A2385_15520 [Bdellovibrionales bacterium RIFOXYB1_FULL_39_21]OFZ41519.1 MAG: hypothetical protein A2485_02210 [Bdellovibrionales bacterium RIFOXYC12_FULL_39_17]OFZ45832.1 MAG: hypothetical protein A2404_12575 [Bdellovibrionales bacterium RIFOXYC1_FULL_39_130]OFZ74763.1 MAG: hypothetical protein A2560_10005 [Bdellovibrionales bacterium RIFOXYD1_FULL_39_84]OFZ77290.1 MAG: hypothetical protein A2451_02255 [Bdellovibrionales bacterium RIFOXYC2_FULL_39_8]OFZ92624.1 MAG:
MKNMMALTVLAVLFISNIALAGGDSGSIGGGKGAQTMSIAFDLSHIVDFKVKGGDIVPANDIKDGIASIPNSYLRGETLVVGGNAPIVDLQMDDGRVVVLGWAE